MLNRLARTCSAYPRLRLDRFRDMDGRHKAGQDEIGGAMFLPSSLRDFPRTALRRLGTPTKPLHRIKPPDEPPPEAGVWPITWLLCPRPSRGLKAFPSYASW